MSWVKYLRTQNFCPDKKRLEKLKKIAMRILQRIFLQIY